MRRFILLLSVLILAFIVAACGNSTQSSAFPKTQSAAAVFTGTL